MKDESAVGHFEQGEIVARVGLILEEPWFLGADLRLWRDRFASLMDQMTRELYARRLDLDDCVLERHARLRWGGSGDEVTITVETVTERRAIVNALLGNKLASNGTDGDLLIEILEVAIQARRATDYPPQRQPG